MSHQGYNQNTPTVYNRKPMPRAPTRPNQSMPRAPRPNPPEDPYLTDAKKFMNLYYDTIDNKRDKIVHLYGTTCRLLFDGNPFAGGDTINEFWQKRFPTSVHTIRTQDYKNHGDNLLVLMTSGEVLLDTHRRTFSQ
uniref:NTF2-related export protein n=1 Tax=Panagrolaimus sp. PS1159 TaxID=55785 RepID=A0AC35F441_9BILA